MVEGLQDTNLFDLLTISRLLKAPSRVPKKRGVVEVIDLTGDDGDEVDLMRPTKRRRGLNRNIRAAQEPVEGSTRNCPRKMYDGRVMNSSDFLYTGHLLDSILGSGDTRRFNLLG